MGYVELHAHSAYSFLDGASLPEELAVQAAELGYEALALTDHDGLYGSLEFAHAAKAFDVRPITGAELTLADGSHVTLLVETPKGYANLCRLITAAHVHTRPAAKPPVRDSGPGEGARGNREVPPASGTESEAAATEAVDASEPEGSEA
jgi:error-prone DNA polymerase